MDRLELPSQYLHRVKKEEEERSEDVSSSSSSSTISDGDLFQTSSRVSGVHTPQPSTANCCRPIEGEEESFSRNEKQEKREGGGDEDSFFSSSSSSSAVLRNRRGGEKERKTYEDDEEKEGKEEDGNQGENLSWSEAVGLLLGTDLREVWRLLNYSIVVLFFISLTFLYFSSSNDEDRDLFLLFSGFVLLLLLFAIVLNW